MTHQLRQQLALAITLALSTAASAQDAGTAAQLFARHPAYRDARLSPTGDYVSVTTPYEERRALSIIKLSGDYQTNVIKFGLHELVENATWVDDKRLVMEKARDIGFLDQPLLTGDWYAADADGSNQKQLFGYEMDDGSHRGRLKDEGYATYTENVEGSGGDALFIYWPAVAGNSSTVTSMYRVDTRTAQRKQVESVPDSVEIVTDHSGRARFLNSDKLDGSQYLRYRRLPTDTEWAQVPEAIAGVRVAFWSFEPDNDHVYARVSDKGEPATLYRISLSTGTRERVAGNPDMEVAGLFRAGHDGAPVAVSYTAGRPKIDFVDPKSEWAQLQSGLLKAFPGQLVSFVDYTRDDNKLLFYVYSDRHPGAYYLYDRVSKKPTMLFETMPWIDPAKMAPMAPIEFTNRSGQKLFGFYTAPLGKSGPLPLVVIPHGGPYGVSDSWSYDSDVQFLASQGYAVLQVNYRGSGERGDDFEKSGWQGWGTTIQDDIADGVRFAVAQKLADPGKVCIYGASFGGYSALMNPIRNPGMYKCAIGYAGVYDLEVQVDAHKSSEQMRAFWSRTMGTTAEIQQAQSPARNVAKLDVPVLLIHGGADSNTPITQFDHLRSALKSAGKPFESLVKPQEGHGFYDEKNQAEAYERMAAFLKKYNPVN